jgi:hypothetical protein
MRFINKSPALQGAWCALCAHARSSFYHVQVMSIYHATMCGLKQE